MYGIKCNIRAPHKFMRMGALCWVTNVNPGSGGEKVEVIGMSRGGRVVQTWMDARDLGNFRAGWTAFDEARWTRDSREDAKEWADALQKRYASDPVRPHAANYAASLALQKNTM